MFIENRQGKGIYFSPDKGSGGGQVKKSEYDFLYEGTQAGDTSSKPILHILKEVGVGIGQILRLVIRMGQGSNPEAIETDRLIRREGESSYQIGPTQRGK